MQDEKDLTSKLDPVERELEAALARLAPAVASLARDQLMFQAGARSVRRSVRTWRCAAAALAACVGAATLIRVPSPATHIADNATPIQLPSPPFQDVRDGPFTVASLSKVVLEHGMDAMPSAPPAPARPADEPQIPSLRNHLFHNPPSGDRS